MHIGLEQWQAILSAFEHSRQPKPVPSWQEAVRPAALRPLAQHHNAFAFQSRERFQPTQPPNNRDLHALASWPATMGQQAWPQGVSPLSPAASCAVPTGSVTQYGSCPTVYAHPMHMFPTARHSSYTIGASLEALGSTAYPSPASVPAYFALQPAFFSSVPGWSFPTVPQTGVLPHSLPGAPAGASSWYTAYMSPHQDMGAHSVHRKTHPELQSTAT